MANTDASYYVLRYDPSQTAVQYFSGADWYNVDLNNSSVLTEKLTGFSASAGAVASTDTILSAFNKVVGNQALYLPLAGGTITGGLTCNGALIGGSNIIAAGTLGNSVTAGNFVINTDNSSFIDLYVIGSTHQISMGSLSPDASAKLQITSTTKGFLPPVMTATQRDAITSPAEGLVVYNTTAHTLSVFNGTSWLNVTIA